MKQFSKDLGNVSLAPKGKWSREQEYEKLALVYNTCDNLSYVAKINVPSGVDIENREYWQPMNATGYADNNFINLTTENENGTITAYETLEEAVATILPINRRAGATLSFYNLNSDRLDRQAEFELWQFNSTDLANWENKDYWNNIYYNWNVFAGWYIGADALKNHIKIPNVGQYAYVGSNLNDALLYQCRTNSTWTNTGIKVRNYISVVVKGNITIGENGNWFSDGEDTGIPATPAVDEQLDNIIMQLQHHTTEINNLKASDANLQDQITYNDSDITNLNAKHEILSITVQGIAATGGASTANNVTYNNNTSRLNAENAQDAIDELQDSKIDKTSILQESGKAKDKVMSQKAVSDKLSDLTVELNMKISPLYIKNNIDITPIKEFAITGYEKSNFDPTTKALKVTIYKAKYINSMKRYINGFSIDSECSGYNLYSTEDAALKAATEIKYYHGDSLNHTGMQYEMLIDLNELNELNVEKVINNLTPTYAALDYLFNPGLENIVQNKAIENINSSIDNINNSIDNINNSIDFFSVGANDAIYFENILCVGDSLTHGDYGSYPEGTANDHKWNYPYYLSRLLNGANVENKGYDGYAATNIWNIKSAVFDESKNYDAILIYLGTNGGLPDNLSVDAPGLDYRNYKTNTLDGAYCAIISYAHEKFPKAKIFLINYHYGRRGVQWSDNMSSVLKKVET